MKIFFVCGTKYGYRSVYAPLCRSLARRAELKLFLLNYPAADEIDAELQAMKAAGVFSEVHLLPTNTSVFHHHGVVARLAKGLKDDRPDVLVVDSDFMPFARYFINAARHVGSTIVAVQKDICTQLVMAYRRETAPASAPKTERAGQTPRRPLTTRVANRLRVHYNRTMHNYVAPLLFSRRTFGLHSYEKTGRILFASTRVDAAIVYDARVVRSLNHFFPRLRVIQARHPRREQCRCGDGRTPASLLVALGGPWVYHIRTGNEAGDILKRWEFLILEARRFRSFDRVVVRPHPRETGGYDEMLVEQLKTKGIDAIVQKEKNISICDTVCDYAGVIGAASGALPDAASSCSRAFVLGVRGIQGEELGDLRISDFSEDVTELSWGQPLTAEHFIRRKSVASTLPPMAAAILDLQGVPR